MLSSSRDSTYRDDDNRNDEHNTNGTGTIAKSSSCSSFLFDILFRGIFKEKGSRKKYSVNSDDSLTEWFDFYYLNKFNSVS